jgi:HAD superfamily hydrolase (TIGR01509 family)
MVDVVLLELEGVLLQTGELRRRALERAFADEGLPVIARSAGDCTALPVRAAVSAALARANEARDETGVDLLTLRAERHFLDSVSRGLTLAAGAGDFVAGLQGSARLAIVTRASRRETELLLSLAGLDLAFETVVTSDDVREPKPAAAPYHVALERLRRRRALTAATVVALEDGVAGIRAARDAGVRCIAVGACPAFTAIEADGYLEDLAGATLETLRALVMRATTRSA